MSEEQNELQSDNIGEAASTSWLSALPEDLQKAESLSKFKDISSLASSYLEAEKNLNSRVAIPKGDAPNEEWNKFYTRLGLPEDKKYTDKRTVEDEEYLKQYEEMFYQSGLSKRQGEKLLNSLYNYSVDIQKKQQEEIEGLRHSNIDWLKKRYNDGFDSKINVMNVALKNFGTKELAGLIEESNYNPALVDMLVKIGETLKSDSLVTGAEKPTITGADSALKEIKRLESNHDFMLKFKDKNHTGHASAIAQMNELYTIAYNPK
ncbi:hypothetical protein [Rickettsia endosymbiont of Polydrusus tereticollis]|uniref:hypothetical protein n=1 Tax=Rickettsia endosymbiont of Polydrusus tereticollis TaxID=3066251 RepID=UPI0031331828